MGTKKGLNLKLGISLIIPLCLCGGKIFKYTDENGRTVYTDKPHLNSEEIILESKGSSSSSTSRQNKAAEETKTRNPNKLYTVTIKEPINGATLSRNNDAKTKVILEVMPELAKEHRVSVFVDGGQIGIPQKEFTFEISNLPAGQHTIIAKVLDNNGRPIKNSTSPAVTVFQPKSTARGPLKPGYVAPAATAPQAQLAPQDKRALTNANPAPQVADIPRQNTTPAPSNLPNPTGLPQPPALPMP